MDDEAVAKAVIDWLQKQRYNDENILHSAVCCDFVGYHHFLKAMAKVIHETRKGE